VKSNTEPALAWCQEQLDNIASWTEPFVSGLRTISRGTLRLLASVARPLIGAIWWTIKACFSVVWWIITAIFSVIRTILQVCIFIATIVFSFFVIVSVIQLIILFPVQACIVIVCLLGFSFGLWISGFCFRVFAKIAITFITQVFRAIGYLVAHSFDCLGSAEDRAEWWITLLGRLGCIIVIVGHFLGADLILIPAGVLLMVILYAISPLVTLFFDSNIINFKRSPTANYILVQLLKAFKEVYQRLGSSFRAFFRGFIPSRLAPIISIFIAGSLLGPGTITIAQIITVVLGIVFALRRDPVIGPHMDDFFAWVAETVDPMLERILRYFGLSRVEVNEWLEFFHSSLMRIISTVTIAIPLQNLVQGTLEQLPGGPASVLIIGIAIVAALVVIFLRRRDFLRGNKLRKKEASKPFHKPRGVPVYASQRATFGSVNHQILIVNHQDGPYKYELKMPENDGQARAEYVPAPTKQARRTVPLKDSGDNFYVYLIGWTTLSHDQIDAFCNTLMPWAYSSRTRNCQHFIRLVGDHIVTTQAMDWGFFARGEETPYQAWLMGQWRITWPIRLLDAVLVYCMPSYLFVREALY
jgi:hypothetical protein